MFKKLLILSMAFIALNANDLPTKSQDMSIEDMRASNKQIASLAVAEMSKSLPQQIDKFTKLVKCEAKDSTIIYTHELSVPPKSDEELKKDGLSRMKDSLIYGTCEHSARFLQADITIRYIYTSASSKAELFRLDIDKKSCAKK